MKKKMGLTVVILGSTLILGSSLIACSPAKVYRPGENNLSSRGPSNPPGGPGTPSIPEGILAECNGLDDAGTGIKAQVSTYHDPYTGQMVYNYIRFHFEKYPAEITATTTFYVQFYRWLEDTPGSPVTNPVPVKILFLQEGTGQVINSGKPINVISKNSITKLINDYGLSSQSITVDNFLKKHILILTEMEMQYDAVAIALYNSSTGTSAVAAADLLLPPFSANPNTYAARHPATALQALHPNQHLRSSGMSDQEYYNQTRSFCEGFFAQNALTTPDRLPASSGPRRFWQWVVDLFAKIRF